MVVTLHHGGRSFLRCSSLCDYYVCVFLTLEENSLSIEFHFFGESRAPFLNPVFFPVSIVCRCASSGVAFLLETKKDLKNNRNAASPVVLILTLPWSWVAPHGLGTDIFSKAFITFAVCFYFQTLCLLWDSQWIDCLSDFSLFGHYVFFWFVGRKKEV